MNGAASECLLALGLVTFQYRQAKDDGSKPIQYGLIAEEVAEVFPELVTFNEEGKPETVSYHLLATLLLNEIQKAQKITQQQAIRITELERQSAELEQLKVQIAAMPEAMARLDSTRVTERTN